MSRPPLPGKHDSDYWRAVQAWAAIHSDGCTGVKDLYVKACWEHDFHYSVGMTFPWPPPEAPWRPIPKAEADARFRQVMQWESRLGRFSPLSWIRWSGVRLFGRYFYHPKPPASRL